MIDVLLLERTIGATLVAQGPRRPRQILSYDPAIVAIEARRSLDEQLGPVVVPDSLAHFDRALTSIACYDSLSSVYATTRRSPPLSSRLAHCDCPR